MGVLPFFKLYKWYQIAQNIIYYPDFHNSLQNFLMETELNRIILIRWNPALLTIFYSEG